ncbi:MAG: S-adenosylmethionine synthetase N-terminal domain-containing protein, partial [Microbacterium gubbeenense]
MSLRLFTSESVTEGHPDKICDQISDSVLDALLTQDPGARVAVETLVTTGLVHVAGEIRTDGYADISTIARDVIRRIGYTSSDMGFDADSCGVTVSVGEQSQEIGDGVTTSSEHRSGSDGDALDQQGA